MNLTRLARWGVGLALAMCLLATASSAGAQKPAGFQPSQTGPVAHRPAATACVLPCLYDQTNNGGSNSADSSDYGTIYPNLSSQAADDFFVPGNAFWNITSVTAAGGYIGTDATPVDSLLVQFYTDAGGGLPQPLPYYSNTIGSGSIGGLDTGVFVVTLSPAVTLGPGHYWYSAQARDQCLSFNCKHWVWTESITPTNSESVWRQPSNSLGKNCQTWKPRVSVCQVPSGSSGTDLLFKLEGSAEAIQAQVFLPIIRR